MFRRLPSGLPEDPVFAQDLKGLGYFINEEDEIRSIENPKAYFKFFLNRNERYNAMQREGMNEAIRQIVWGRLEGLGLIKLRLPLGAKENEPHVPILISDNLREKKKIIVLFYEHTQDLGIFAHRVIGGKGGINAGSAVDFVKHIQAQSLTSGTASPGIVLANCGQLRWSRRFKKAMTQVSWYAMPQKSCVDPPYHFNEQRNTVFGNRSTFEHVSYIFNNFLADADVCDQNAEIQVIGVSDGAVQASVFLENPDNFAKWCGGSKPKTSDRGSGELVINVDEEKTKALAMNGKYRGRITAFAALGTYYYAQEIRNKDFKTWLADRGRVYVVSDDPVGQFIAPPEGTKKCFAYGAPAFSAGEPYYAEVMLIKGYKNVLGWFAEVSGDPDYINPKFERFEIGGDDDDDEDLNKLSWGKENTTGFVEAVPEESKQVAEAKGGAEGKARDKFEATSETENA